MGQVWSDSGLLWSGWHLDWSANGLVSVLDESGLDMVRCGCGLALHVLDAGGGGCTSVHLLLSWCCSGLVGSALDLSLLS